MAISETDNDFIFHTIVKKNRKLLCYKYNLPNHLEHCTFTEIVKSAFLNSEFIYLTYIFSKYLYDNRMLNFTFETDIAFCVFLLGNNVRLQIYWFLYDNKLNKYLQALLPLLR